MQTHSSFSSWLVPQRRTSDGHVCQLPCGHIMLPASTDRRQLLPACTAPAWCTHLPCKRNVEESHLCWITVPLLFSACIHVYEPVHVFNEFLCTYNTSPTPVSQRLHLPNIMTFVLKLFIFLFVLLTWNPTRNMLDTPCCTSDMLSTKGIHLGFKNLSSQN